MSTSHPHRLKRRLAVATVAAVATGALVAVSSGGWPAAIRQSAESTTSTASTASLASVAVVRARTATPPTVRSQRVIGHSVRKHAIRAYELGRRAADHTVVLIGAMHGDETEGSTVISALMAGRPIRGVHIWAIRRDNPDGVLAGNRRNAHGVDLNRNFPTRWRPLTGDFYSGPRPASEPETRVLMRFLDRVKPDHVVTMHSPLHGIDVYGAKDRPFARRLARQMRLPLHSFNCAGVCHGTLTQWFNKHHAGACVTVEFGEHPSSRYLNVGAPRGLVRAIGGRFRRQ